VVRTELDDLFGGSYWIVLDDCNDPNPPPLLCSATFIFIVLIPSEEDDPGDEVITGEGKRG